MTQLKSFVLVEPVLLNLESVLNELTKIKEPTMCDRNWIFVMHIDDTQKLDQEVATSRDICRISRSLGIYILFGYAVFLTETECQPGKLVFREYKQIREIA